MRDLSTESKVLVNRAKWATRLIRQTGKENKSFQHSFPTRRRVKVICKDRSFQPTMLSPSQVLPLVHNSTTPLTARNLHSSTHSQAHSRVTEQRSVGAAVQTQVKVEVGAVLVGSAESVLSAQGVARRRAQVGDLDDDAVACVGELVA